MSEPTVPPPPPAAPPANTGDKTLMLVLSYLGLLALIPLLTEKDDPNVQWHAKHGLVQMIFFFIVCVVIQVLGSIGIGCVFLLLLPFVGLAWMIVAILSIVKATKGQRFMIPVISDFANKF